MRAESIIFFVDGDVELYPEFLSDALAKIQSGEADAVTGKLREIQYTPDYQKELRQSVRRKAIVEEIKLKELEKVVMELQ